MISLQGTCTTDKRLGKFEDDNDMIDTCVGRVKYSTQYLKVCIHVVRYLPVCLSVRLVYM